MSDSYKASEVLGALQTSPKERTERQREIIMHYGNRFIKGKTRESIEAMPASKKRDIALEIYDLWQEKFATAEAAGTRTDKPAHTALANALGGVASQMTDKQIASTLNRGAAAEVERVKKGISRLQGILLGGAVLIGGAGIFRGCQDVRRNIDDLDRTNRARQGQMNDADEGVQPRPNVERAR